MSLPDGINIKVGAGHDPNHNGFSGRAFRDRVGFFPRVLR